jgi:site-specific DNA recombinase
MRIAIYARVSTARQAENDLSIPDQVRQLHAWAKQNGHTVVAQFIEPGASAMDDKRPVFQRMIEQALIKPAPFELIAIHSFSRFFRDAIQFGVYERKLLKNKVKVESITQQTGDDTAGEMMRRIINTFDEYNSKENSKHTSRAMKENARQGFFNGSKPPYGYEVIATDMIGSRGRKKKKLIIHPEESRMVHKIYELYRYGLEGRQLGCKEIAMYLNQHGYLRRGQPFTMQKVHSILSDPLYNGDYYFNVRDSKTGETRPASEWVKTTIPAIVDAQTYEAVKAKRELRAPEKTPAARTVSKTLLSGLIRCGICGHFMTLATGKSGKYKYYKCTNRCSKGNTACLSKSLPMDETNQKVLNALADQVFAPKRLQTLLAEYRSKTLKQDAQYQENINHLNRQIQQIEERQKRLLDAIELGALELDEITLERSQDLKRSKEALLIERNNFSQSPNLVIPALRTSQLDKLGQLLRTKLLSDNTDIAKGYLNLLVKEVRVLDSEIDVSGSIGAIAHIAKATQRKMGTSNEVPISIPDWRARSDSNARPFGS